MILPYISDNIKDHEKKQRIPLIDTYNGSLRPHVMTVDITVNL